MEPLAAYAREGVRRLLQQQLLLEEKVEEVLGRRYERREWRGRRAGLSERLGQGATTEPHEWNDHGAAAAGEGAGGALRESTAAPVQAAHRGSGRLLPELYLHGPAHGDFDLALRGQVLVAALRDGRKVVIAVDSGYREWTESWAPLLRNLQSRGLRAPRLVVSDGHLGIWGAVLMVVESPRAAVRLRTGAAKRFKKVANATAVM